tara:strand:+ start:1190 stop:1858 length:669 start_codon:yes stop_codon:yes gene_type:complete
MLKKILIVDDEPDILEFLRYNLEKSNYVVESVLNGVECLKKLEDFQPSLILLDVMMPKMNGVETCEEIRKIPNFKDVVVVFLSARSEAFSQIACYDAGGDDFISKPIQPKLLVKKIDAIFQRMNQGVNNDEINGVYIDNEKYLVFCNNTAIKLPKKQFELLKLLYSKPGKVFARDYIISMVWGTNYFISSRNIDVQIRKIREKIGHDKIETIKGVGYRFNEE